MNLLVSLLLTLVPLAWGWLIARFHPDFYFQTMAVWELVFIAYWFWVGTRFARTEFHPTLSFALGNVAWAVSLGLYLWRFRFVDDAHRVPGLLTTIGQLYPVGLTWFGARIAQLFTSTITWSHVILPYALMLGIFLAGFRYGRREKLKS